MDHGAERLELSAGYRASRRNTSVLCAIGLAWAAAQFDLRSFSLAGANVELTGASIPLVLVCAIMYTTIRSCLEYAMQPLEVRRWGYARLDLNLDIWLVRATAILLAASVLGRSLQTVAYVALAVVGIAMASAVAAVIFAFLLFLPISFFRRRQGLKSAVSLVQETLAWAEIATYILLLILIIALAVAAIYYPPIRSLWPSPPAPFAIVFAALTTIAVLASFVFHYYWFLAVCAQPLDYTELAVPGGNPIRQYHGRPSVTWDWGFDWVERRDRKVRAELADQYLRGGEDRATRE